MGNYTFKVTISLYLVLVEKMGKFDNTCNLQVKNVLVDVLIFEQGLMKIER